MQQYKTIRCAKQAEFTEKHSRFIGYIAPAVTAQEATDFVAEIKTRHWDATHNVPAFILRENHLKRFSDDGEPQGTAGMPALNVLEKNELTDCVLVVTRYFGGTLLGTGGLVRAYSHAAALAVEAGGIVTRALCDHLEVCCDYGFYGKLNPMVMEAGGVLEDTVFADCVTLRFRLQKSVTPVFCAKLIDVSNGKYNATVTGESFADLD